MFETYSDLFTLSHPDRFFVDGRWVAPLGDRRLDVIFPGTDKVIATPPEATVADIDRAVDAARRAFDDGNGAWARLSLPERAQKLFRIAAILHERAPDFAKAWIAETGCEASLAGPGSYGAAAIFTYYGNMILRGSCEEVRPQSMRPGVGIVVREPMGVVAAITPWNAPLLLSCKIVAPALAAGCSVILKPAPETPLFAWLLADCIEAADLPPGVFGFVPAGREVADHLVRHPGVASVCGQRLARVSLELGGKSPAVILDDADPGLVVPKLIPHFTTLAGQMCLGLTRIIVPENRHDDYADAIGTALKQLKVGDPFDPESAYGPLAMKRQYDRVLGYFDQGRDEGARVITGACRQPGQDIGHYVAPTLFSGTNDMVISREEIFGPVAILITHKGDEDAIRIANDTEYGLNGAVYTSDPARAYAVARRVRTGTMTHNDAVNDFTFPFGGFKSSGIGRDGGPEGLALFQETKTVFMDAPPPSLALAMS
jgi:acyl-CoA reductase-like NAD-dependent aldehyde dehydrogenase